MSMSCFHFNFVHGHARTAKLNLSSLKISGSTAQNVILIFFQVPTYILQTAQVSISSCNRFNFPLNWFCANNKTCYAYSTLFQISIQRRLIKRFLDKMINTIHLQVTLVVALMRSPSVSNVVVYYGSILRTKPKQIHDSIILYHFRCQRNTVSYYQLDETTLFTSYLIITSRAYTFP